MYRRDFLKITGVALSGLVAGIPDVSFGAENTQPNLVVFIADDLGWNDVGYHGSEIDTPGIDSIVADGVELDRNYAYPVCSPTRAAFLTGRHSYNNGVHTVVKSFNGLSLDEHIMPETFKLAGYQTYMIGKWHLGGDICEGQLPHNRGYDHFYGFIGGAIDPYTHNETTPNGVVDFQRNGVTVYEDGYCSDLFAAEAITLIENRDTTKPFFMCFNFHASHTPLVAPDDLIQKYTDRGVETNRATFAAKTDSMDAAIASVIASLEGQGITGDTLILFTSDNGGNNTYEGGADNTPLNGNKGTTFEGGIRVPAAIKWPGVLAAGQKCTQVISVADYFPTLTTALGVAPGNTKPFDGINRWDQIRGVASDVAPSDLIIASTSVAIFNDNWKLVYRKLNGNDVYSLYDIDSDPNETTNVLSSHRYIANPLKAKIAPYIALSMDSHYDPDSSGTTDTGDVRLVAENWLEEGDAISGDIAPGCGDGKVDMQDLAKLSEHWLDSY